TPARRRSSSCARTGAIPRPPTTPPRCSSTSSSRTRGRRSSCASAPRTGRRWRKPRSSGGSAPRKPGSSALPEVAPPMVRRMTFVHLSGPRRGELDDVPLPTDVGSGPGSPVRVPGVAPAHCQIFERDGDLMLRDSGSESGTLLAGEPVHEAVLRDGDVIELGRGGPKLRLRDDQDKIPLGKALGWARPEGSPHLSDARFLARALLHETHLRTSPLFRWAVGLVLVAGVAVLAWSQWQAAGMRDELARLREDVRDAEQERLSFYKRIEEERRQADRQPTRP